VCFEYSAPHRCPAAQGIPKGFGRRAPVGSTGRCGILFFDYRRQHGLNIKVARIFNTYGPRMQPDDGRVVSNFIVQALRREPITLYGDGSQTRSFCYVDDMIEGFLRLMETEDTLTVPVNLGNPCEFTVRQLAEKILAITGSRSKSCYPQTIRAAAAARYHSRQGGPRVDAKDNP
jgi:UDP-glucuronate decarboxylase